MNDKKLVVTTNINPWTTPESDYGNPIERFIWCKKCKEDIEKINKTSRKWKPPGGWEPRSYVHNLIGLTKENTLVVWCGRHEEMVCEYIIDTHIPEVKK